jgi:hypothetical protein
MDRFSDLTQKERSQISHYLRNWAVMEEDPRTVAADAGIPLGAGTVAKIPAEVWRRARERADRWHEIADAIDAIDSITEDSV